MTKNFKTLVQLCNLAIPPNKHVEYGLGGLLCSDTRKEIVESTNYFLENNKKYLDIVNIFLSSGIINYGDIMNKLIQENQCAEMHKFIDELRIFMVKCYFSNPYVLSKTGLINEFLNAKKYLSSELDLEIISNLSHEK